LPIKIGHQHPSSSSDQSLIDNTRTPLTSKATRDPTLLRSTTLHEKIGRVPSHRLQAEGLKEPIGFAPFQRSYVQTFKQRRHHTQAKESIGGVPNKKKKIRS